MDMNLTNRNALVGGGSKGIGRATAIELALLGANVTLLARNEADLRKAVAELDTSKGQQHSYLSVDSLNTDELRHRITELAASKDIHILINNTGGPPGGRAVDADAAEYLNAFTAH